MTARELLDQQRITMAEEIQALLDVSDDGVGHIVEYGARWGTALRAVLDLHKPVSWFTECMDHSRDEDADHGVEHFYVGADGDVWACEDTRELNVCQECTPDDADDNETPPVPHPCPTVQTIATALEAS